MQDVYWQIRMRLGELCIQLVVERPVDTVPELTASVGHCGDVVRVGLARRSRRER